MAHVQDELDFSRAQSVDTHDDVFPRVDVAGTPSPAELRLVPWSGDGDDPLSDTAAAPESSDASTDGLNPPNRAALEDA